MTIFITGGATGIGAATAALFLEKGWNVAVADHNPEAATANLAACTGDNGRWAVYKTDVRRQADLTAAANAAAERFGAINAVFANAGIHRKNTLLTITDEELDTLIDTNIKGCVYALRAVVPHIIAAGGGSVVINASDQVFIGKGGNFGYGLTKGALGQITRSLSVDLAPHGIRVNAVCPGTIATPMVDRIFEDLSRKTGTPVSEYWEEENALFNRGRVGTPDEVARAVYFLTDRESASFITGALLPVDGGLTAR